MNRDLRPEIDQLREWIVQKSAREIAIGDDDDLIESRLLDSLAFLEFVYVVEEVFGREVILDDSVAEHFRTLAAVCRHFKTGARHAGE
jgi:acyl carrier protein